MKKFIAFLIAAFSFPVYALDQSTQSIEQQPQKKVGDKARLVTPEDRDKFEREHPNPPTLKVIPFRPALGLKQYQADKEAAEALKRKRLNSRHKKSRVDEINGENK